MPKRQPIVFFAIPCGEFYAVQHEIIQQVEQAIGIKAVIIEDHIQTKDLWSTIISQIDSADLFVADVSSGSFNIALELGYAIRQKLERNIGIFIAKSRAIPSDLQGFVRQEYSSFNEFQSKLTAWIYETLNLVPSKTSRTTRRQHNILFRDDFTDQDVFLRRWSVPPNASYLLTHEGLRFTSGMFPILTTTLGLLRDCEIEFSARIEQERLGWVIKGTKSYTHFILKFCVMLQIDSNGKLTPHIWNERQPHAQSVYHVYPSKQVSLKIGRDGWFQMTTRIRDNRISFKQDQRRLFSADFSKDPYAHCYNDFPHKDGQIGFRCYPNEEAVVRYVEVREPKSHQFTPNTAFSG